MAQSENMKKLHQREVELANVKFEEYKKEITQKFIDQFGHSYQTIDSVGEIWRNQFQYRPECEDFLKFRTRIFLRLLPINDEIYSNPRFLRILIRNICEYLSAYIVRKENGLNRNIVSNELFDQLFNKNSHVQRKSKYFQKEKNRKWAQIQKENADKKTVNKEQKKRAHRINAQPIELSTKEQRTLLKRRLIEKKKELGIKTRHDFSLTKEQYETMIQKYKAAVKISISVRVQ